MSKIDIVELLELKLVAKCMIIPTLYVVGFWIFN